jgi:hypothetical protein
MGSSGVASGVLRPGQPAFQLAFTPAVDPTALGWSVAWLCGLRQSPPGWTSPLPAVRVQNLSNAQLPSVCRDTPNP